MSNSANEARARESEAMRLELQEANRRLREATEQFQAMFEQGMFAARLRLDGTVIDINRAAVEVCGLNRADILDRPFWECGWWNRSPDVQAWVRNAVEQAVSGEPFRGESRYFWGDGSEHIVDFGCVPIRDASGRVVVVIPTGMDITERVRAEQNQRALEVERRRVEALAEIDRAKTQFFANISHEFRTPLTLMLGPLEDMKRDAADAVALTPHYAQVDLVHRNGLRLLKLVNTLLDFSRIEAGRVQALYEPTDLAQLTADIASEFRSAIEKAGLRLVVNAPAPAEPAYVDREMWEKIVLNLLSNAFKFTFEGTIEVSLRQKSGKFQLAITDTGTGIPPDELPRLFERFHRVEGAKGRTYEGSGIGLALVQELARLHGGIVTVESEYGKGSTFRVSIPAGKSHLPQQQIGGTRTQASGLGARPFVEEALRWLPGEVQNAIIDDALPADQRAIPGAERPRVLLADDNVDMREYLCRLLATEYECTAVNDGEEALAAARQQRPDLILVDVMMPRLDGFGLLQELRGDSDLRSVPVILLSARAGDEAKVEGLQTGADDYLVKPFSARELRARVAANIELSKTRVKAAQVMQEEAQTLDLLNKVGIAVAAELDLERAVQVVTDAATELSGAAFGSFFYNVIDEKGETYTLYTLAGVPREAFANFPMPRNTAVFGPTFRGEGIVRSDDITKDPRYGKNAPHRGMPNGHLPLRSYLAAPVKSRSGEVLGGLFFGHPEVGIFSERAERIVAAIAVQAGIAIDKARLYRAAQDEIERRKRVEAQLRDSEQTLEARVVERTLDLRKAQEQLVQSQKMEAIGQLTGGMAHDFNNLLTIVMGNLESIQRNLAADAPARLRRWAENSMHGAKRAATLTQHLLAFSRRQPLDPKPTEVNKLIATTSEVLGRTLGERVEVQTVLGAGVWNVEVDPNQLETALLNLAVNARDAMPDGGKLTIETTNTHLDDAYVAQTVEVLAGQYVAICVSDTGSGMSKETLDHAFEPFFTTKPTGQGTGLGLSQVYGFVKQSGGHVKIYSEEGQGTTVKLYLPRLVGKGVEAADEGQARTIPDGNHKETVLLVEDDPGVREYSAEILRDLGYTVIEAKDGPAALRQIERNETIDLLFTDIGLPGMNGRELADEAVRRRPKLKVLYTSAYARNAIVHHGRLDPGVHLITKPFVQTELATKIRAVMDGGVI